jgi:glycosyltransferase involved in cell wall biosynthesis
VVRIPDEAGWRPRLRRYADPLSRLRYGTFSARVRELAADADVVHLEEIRTAAVGRRLSVPYLANLHSFARRDRRVESLWTTDTRDYLELARAERRACREARWLVASSTEVASDLRRSGARDVTVVRLGLDTAHYGVRDSAGPDAAGLIGHAAWPPTANAVTRLITEVWPRVREARPAAVLRLAGRGMTRDAFAELPDVPGVEWVGPVESAEGFLRSIGVLCYPLGRGSGIKVKVLEAMAIGMPVVTTPHGAEGLAPGLGIAVETDADRLAAATVELLDSPELRRRRGAAARAQFERDHSPAAVTAPLLPLYHRMAASGH